MPGVLGRGVCCWQDLLRLSSCLSLPCAIGAGRNHPRNAAEPAVKGFLQGSVRPLSGDHTRWLQLCSPWHDVGRARGVVP